MHSQYQTLTESKRFHRRISKIVLGVVIAICMGCGSGRFSVDGAVSFDGEPVQEGAISFEPVDGNGPSTGGRITAGRYALTGEAAPLPGKKIVRIHATRKTGRQIRVGPPAPPGTMTDEVVHYIPDDYNTRSTITCEVLPQKSNEIDFKLKSP